MKDTEEFAAAHGLKWVQVEIYHAEVTALVSSEDAQGATAALAKLRAVLSPSRRMDLAYFRYQEAGVLMLQGRVREAAEAARRCGEDRARERPARDADPALPRARGAVPRPPAARCRKRSRSTTRRSRSRPEPTSATSSSTRGSCMRTACSSAGDREARRPRMRELLAAVPRLGLLRLPAPAGRRALAAARARARGRHRARLRAHADPQAQARAAGSRSRRLAVAGRAAHVRRVLDRRATA